MARFPKPYVNDIPVAGAEPCMEYPPLHNMTHGAVKAGMPSRASNGPHGIQHVGSDPVGNGGGDTRNTRESSGIGRR